MLTKASQRVSESLFLCHYFIPTYSRTAHLTSNHTGGFAPLAPTVSSKAQPTDKEGIMMVISAQYRIFQPFFFWFWNPMYSDSFECFTCFVCFDSSLSPSSQTVNCVPTKHIKWVTKSKFCLNLHTATALTKDLAQIESTDWVLRWDKDNKQNTPARGGSMPI